MNITIEVDNKRLFKAIDKAGRELSEELSLAYIEIGNKLSKQAKDDHRWITRTGNLEKDIWFSNFKTYLSFGLGYNVAMTMTEDGITYGEILHKKYDAWLQRAVDTNLDYIRNRLNNAVKNAIKRAGL